MATATRRLRFRRKSAAYDILVVAGQAAIDRYAAHGVQHSVEEVQDSWASPNRKHRNRDDSNFHRRQPGRAVRTDLVRRRLQNNHSSLPIGTAIVSALLAPQCNSDLQAAPGPPQTPRVRCSDCRNSEAPPSRRQGDASVHTAGAQRRTSRALPSLPTWPMRWWPTSPESSRTSCNR